MAPGSPSRGMVGLSTMQDFQRFVIDSGRHLTGG